MTFDTAKKNVIEVLEPWAIAQPGQVVQINGKNWTRQEFLDTVKSDTDGFFVRQFCKENLGIELD